MAIRCRDSEKELLEVGPDCKNINVNCNPFATAFVPATTVCAQDLSIDEGKGLYPPGPADPAPDPDEASIVVPNELPGIESWVSTDDSVFLEENTGNILTTSDLDRSIAEVREKAIGGARAWDLNGKHVYWQLSLLPAVIPSNMNGYPTMFATLLATTGGLARKATNLIDYSKGFTFFILFNNIHCNVANSTIFGAYNATSGLANWRITCVDPIVITNYNTHNIRVRLDIYPSGSIADEISTNPITINYPRGPSDRFLLVARYDGQEIAELWVNGGIPEEALTRIYREPIVDLSYATSYDGVGVASPVTPEWVLYQRALTDVELNSIVLYFNNKYATSFGEYLPYRDNQFLYIGSGGTSFTGLAHYFAGLFYPGGGNLTFASTAPFIYGPGAVTKTDMFWFRVSSLSTTNGAAITQWTDSVNSGLLYGLATALGDDVTYDDPTVVYPGMNGLSSALCTGASFFIAGPTDVVANRAVGELFDSATTYTIISVAKTGSSLGGLWGTFADGGQTTTGFYRDNTEDVFYFLSDIDGDALNQRTIPMGPTNILAGTSAGNHILTSKVDLSSGAAELYVDGRLYGKTILMETGSLPVIGTDPVAGGFIYGGSFESWNNQVGDVVVYKEWLNSTQQQAVEDSFASTYGITLYRLPSTPTIYLDGSMLLHQSSSSTSSYTNALTLNGQTVGGIRDAIDTTKVLNQTTANKRPTASLTDGYLSFDITGGAEDSLSGTVYGDPPTTGDMTIGVLLHIPSGVTFSFNNTIFEWRANVTNGLGSILMSFMTNGRVQVNAARNDSTPTYKRYIGYCPNFTLVEDNTYFILCRFNDTAKTWDMRVNNTTIAISNTSDTTSLQSTLGCRIGTTANETPFYFYAGLIYQRYLTSQESSDLYNYFKLRADI